MFVATTQIFTDSGFKKIEDVSGHDKVLVRNFIGDAEFIQPFALKKRQYEGEILTIGAKNWSFSVTPDHRDIDAEKFVRTFKYMFPDQPPKEDINIRDEFGKRNVTISDYDWYKLMGYVLMRGFINKTNGKPSLWLFLKEDRAEEEIAILGDILSRIGVKWHIQYSEKTSPKIVISSNNTLVNRVITRLGSAKRKEMFLTDKIIYNLNKELVNLLIDTIRDASGAKKGERWQLVTTNKALIDSLTLLGTLNGYSMWSTILKTAGTPSFKGVAKKDSYILEIFTPTKLYTRKYTKKSTYSGYVYGIDLFEGQVYVREGTAPIWVSPK